MNLFNPINLLNIILLILPLNLLSQTTRTLDYYLNEGVKNSPLLKDYANQIKSRQNDSLIISANQKPQVSAIGAVMLAPVFNGYGYDQSITRSEERRVR